MVRKDQAQGKVVVHKGLGQVSLAQNVVLLYVARGSALVQYPNNSSHQMRAADYLRLTSFPTPINLECDAGSVVLAVHIDRFQT